MPNYDDNITAFLSSLSEKAEGIKSGYAKIDRATNGFRRKSVLVIGARPSTGKTSFALNLVCKGFLAQGYKVAVYTLEMSAETILERIATIITDISYSRIINRQLSEAEKLKIQENIEKVKNNIRIVDSVFTIEEICKDIEESKPDIFVVDYAQILQTQKKAESTKQRIDIISAEIKRIAKAQNCLAVVLSQINRQSRDAPTMSDLKESGALEQDADYVIILHRPFVSDKTKNPAETILTLDKNRYGAVGRTTIYFSGNTQKFNAERQNENDKR